ncbi:gamma-glutamyltransferase [Ghiorsea bivora]|uniref:gamma-glutamyltransferase n=1 Tax=Ghiorsea bivora TaxID=1485545 RepID=UPI0006900E6D|nr:gamma-glutamyltransferase [Ghiorsea bivora]
MKTLIIILILACSQAAYATTLPKQNMVASAHPLATQAGIDILKQGGNAFDAAAALALTIGVAEPTGSGIGGGGFFLLYIAKENRYVMLDAREMSPTLAGNGEIYKIQSSINGPQSAGVPGLIAGIDRLITTYGNLDRKRDAEAAIHIAKHGFKVSKHYQRVALWRKDVLETNAAKNIFLHQSKVPNIGNLIQQPELASTLERFTQHGADDFYRGETAKRLVADMKKDGGLIRLDDLKAYRVIEREPVHFQYQGFQWISAALPSSGGITLAETLGILKNDKLNKLSEEARTHLIIEAMKLAYKDRNQYLGDRDFVAIPDLRNEKRLQKLRTQISMKRVTPSSSFTADPSGNGVDTTHFSIIDKEGNMVAATLSINYGFGSGYVSPRTGILLNDEMDDFATQVGKPNAYGLVQGKANAVAPHKRMLSSMSPTFILDKHRTFIVGTPGGSRIISMVLLAGLEFMQGGSNVSAWINKPRFHHQYLPDVVQHEQGAFTPKLLKQLQNKGHKFKEIRNYGNMHAIMWNTKTGQVIGASDKRGEGITLSTP